MMLQPYAAYIDGSTGMRTERILLLSACIQTYQKWAEFSREWELALKAPPSIRFLHMKEARSLQGEFEGWRAIDRDLKIIALTEIIVRREPHVVNCWFSTKDYEEVVRPAAPSDLRHAYSLAFHAIVQTVAEFQMCRGITTPVEYVFDEQGEVGNEALIWYEATKATAPQKIRTLMGSTPVFRKDEEVLPLQAADLIAWHHRRRIERPGRDPETVATARIDELPGAERNFPREWLEGIASKFQKVPNIGLCMGKPSVYQKLKKAIKYGKREI